MPVFFWRQIWRRRHSINVFRNWIDSSSFSTRCKQSREWAQVCVATSEKSKRARWQASNVAASKEGLVFFFLLSITPQDFLHRLVSPLPNKPRQTPLLPHQTKVFFFPFFLLLLHRTPKDKTQHGATPPQARPRGKLSVFISLRSTAVALSEA